MDSTFPPDTLSSSCCVQEEPAKKPAVPFYAEGRFWFVLLAFLQPLFSSGLLFGWNGLLLILQRENTYSFKCSTNSTSSSSQPVTCVELDAYLNYIVSVATAIQLILSLPAGILIDKLGPKFVIVAQLFATVGCVFMAVAEPKVDSVDFFFLGLILMNAFGLSIAPAFFHYAHLYPQGFNIISAMMTSSVSISSAIFPLMNVLQEFFRVTRSQILYGYSCIVGLFLVVSFIQPKGKFYPGSIAKFSWKSFSVLIIPPIDTNENLQTTEITEDSIEMSSFAKEGEQLTSSYVTNTDSKRDYLSEMNSEILGNGSTSPTNVMRAYVSTPESIHCDANLPPNSTSMRKYLWGQSKQFLLELKKGVLSRYFFVIFIHLSIWGFIFLFFLTSVNSQLVKVTSDMKSQIYYTAIFSWIAPFGILGSFTTAIILDKWGFRKAWFFQISGGIIFCILILLPSLPSHFVAFFLYTLVQEEVYAISLTFINRYLPAHLFCSFFGIITFFEGMILLSIPPIVSSILFNGGYFASVNIIFLCLGIISLGTPLLLSWEPEKILEVMNLNASGII